MRIQITAAVDSLAMLPLATAAQRPPAQHEDRKAVKHTPAVERASSVGSSVDMHL